MELDLSAFWKIIGVFGGVFGVLNIAFIKPTRDRILSLESKMNDRFTKEETKEAIEVRQEAIRSEIRHLAEGIDSLNVSINSLSETMKSIQMQNQHHSGEREERRRNQFP